MEIPEKIYLQVCGTCESSNECTSCSLNEGETTWCTDRIYATDAEYVNKSKLLEWVKEKREQYNMLNQVTDDPVHWGQRNLCQQLIDKLENL